MAVVYDYDVWEWGYFRLTWFNLTIVVEFLSVLPKKIVFWAKFDVIKFWTNKYDVLTFEFLKDKYYICDMESQTWFLKV